MEDSRADDLNEPTQEFQIPQPGTEESDEESDDLDDPTKGPGNVSVDEPTEGGSGFGDAADAAPDPEERLHEKSSEDDADS